MGEVVVSQNDTVVFDSLTDDENPYNAVFWDMDDGSAVTNTHAAGDNEVTITAVVTDVRCVYMVYGVKA